MFRGRRTEHSLTPFFQCFDSVNILIGIDPEASSGTARNYMLCAVAVTTRRDATRRCSHRLHFCLRFFKPMHTFRESVARTYLQRGGMMSAQQPRSEQIPCCNDYNHSFNKLSRLRASEKCATIHQQFAVTFCAAATEPRRRRTELSSTRLRDDERSQASSTARKKLTRPPSL